MSGISEPAFAARSPKRSFADMAFESTLDPTFSIKRPRASSFPDLRASQRFWESRTSSPSLAYSAAEDTVLTAQKSFHGFRERSQADDHLQAVATALSKAPGYSEACQKMFKSLVHGSLGPKHQERDDIQTQAAAAIEPILLEIEASLQAELAPAQAALETKMSEKKNAEEVVREKETDTSDVRRCSAALAAAEKQCQEARKRLQDTQTRIRPLETAFQQVVQEKTKLEDVYNLHFVPLKSDGHRGDTTQHVTKLEPLFRSWGCEDCILAGFRAAAKHENCDRGEWCQIVMLELEKLFEAPLREATQKCEVQEATLARIREELAELERRLKEAESERAAAAASLSAAQEAEREAQAALRAARDALARVMRDLEALQKEFQRREAEVVRFRRDVLSSYQWLLKHSHTCSAGYITRASAHYHDSDVQDKLGKLVRCMQEVHGRSEMCRAMLAGVVCGSLGPTKKERNAIQVQVAGFVKTALGTAEDHFKVQVEEAERALESKRSDLAKAEEEQKSREVVLVRAREAMQQAPVDVGTAEKNCSDMKMRLRDTKSELQAAERTLQQLAMEVKKVKEVYTNDFLAIKSGSVSHSGSSSTSFAASSSWAGCLASPELTSRQVFKSVKGGMSRHVHALQQLFRSWGCEESLVAGLPYSQGRFVQCETGGFCEKVMTEFDTLFQTHIDEAQEKWSAQQDAVVRARQAVKDAEAACQAAEAERSRATANLNVARKAEQEAKTAFNVVQRVTEKAKKLVERHMRELEKRQTAYAHFQSCCVSNYSLLLDRDPRLVSTSTTKDGNASAQTLSETREQRPQRRSTSRKTSSGRIGSEAESTSRKRTSSRIAIEEEDDIVPIE